MLGGVLNGKPFLCVADLYGNYFEADNLSTGFLKYLCQTLIDKGYNENMSY